MRPKWDMATWWVAELEYTATPYEFDETKMRHGRQMGPEMRHGGQIGFRNWLHG